MNNGTIVTLTALAVCVFAACILCSYWLWRAYNAGGIQMLGAWILGIIIAAVEIVTVFGPILFLLPMSGWATLAGWCVGVFLVGWMAFIVLWPRRP